MARVLYGVMGDARGHVTRTRAVVESLGPHSYLFVGGGRALELESLGHRVLEIPMAATFYAHGRVDPFATLVHAVRVLIAQRRSILARVRQAIVEFDPDLILTDFEHFTAAAARLEGRPCVSIDHQHVVTHCVHRRLPAGGLLGRWATGLSIRWLYSLATRYLITSFFDLPPVDPATAEVFPPVLRRSVLGLAPASGDHVLVYLTSPTFGALLPVLEAHGRPCRVYGAGEGPARGCVSFCAPSSGRFLEDLASCRYAICNGGHNVLSEALHLGKPVLAFPIPGAHEQGLNAHHLRELGYGSCQTTSRPASGALDAFEARLPEFRDRVRGRSFVGNRILANRVEELVRTGRRGLA